MCHKIKLVDMKIVYAKIKKYLKGNSKRSSLESFFKKNGN